MDDTLLLVAFDDDTHARDALAQLRALDAQHVVAVREAATVARSETGQLTLTDEFVPHDDTATAGGGFIGALLGGLAGPVGVPLGAAIGALGGDLYGTDDAHSADAALEQIARSIANGSTALVAAIGDYGVEPVASAMRDLGGSVSRYSRADVESELAAARKKLSHH